jgi:hypothetical protein
MFLNRLQGRSRAYGGRNSEPVGWTPLVTVYWKEGDMTLRS